MNQNPQDPFAAYNHVFAVPGSGNCIDFVHSQTFLSQMEKENLEQIQKRYPGAKLYTYDEWRKEKAASQNCPIKWIPSDKEEYYEMLNVLPPIYGSYSNYFAVSEPYDHHAISGLPRYNAFHKSGNSYFRSNRPITVPELKSFR